MEKFIDDEYFNFYPSQVSAEYDFDCNLISNLNQMNSFNDNSNQFYSQNYIHQPLSQSQNNFQSEKYPLSQNYLNQTQDQSFISLYPQINKSYILKMRESLKEKIEKFFNLVIEKLLKNELLELNIIDLEKTSKFNFDEGYYVLPENTNEYFYYKFILYYNSSKIAKIFKLMTIICQKIYNCSSSTKRELYYNNVELFKSVENINNILNDICSLLVINRFELPIFPSAKGLFCGNINLKNQYGDQLNISNNNYNKINLITYEYFTDEFTIDNTNKPLFILIVEKETIFFNLLENNLFTQVFKNIVLITGKGYPDYLTKIFIKKIYNLYPDIPYFYFGDHDPNGIEIYLNYLFGSKKSSRENEFMSINNLKWIGLNEEMINNIMYSEEINNNNIQKSKEQFGLIKMDHKDLDKIKSLLQKEYFNLDLWIPSINPFKDILTKNLSVVYYELNQMLNNGYKAEGEFLISKYCQIFIENINANLIVN